MDGDEVGFGVDRLDRVGPFESQLVEALGRHEGVVGHHPHLQSAGPFGDQKADAPEADDAQRLAGQLDAAVLGTVPATLLEGAMGLGDVARAGHDHGDRVLGGRQHVAGRRVDYDDAALGRGLDVDVVDPDPGAADHLEVGGRLDDLGGDLGRRADDQRIVVADPGQELVGCPVEPGVDLEALLFEVLDAFGGKLLLDQDSLGRGAHSATSLLRKTCSAAPTEAPHFTS